MERERGLVAVVAVGDQELGVDEALGRVLVQPPEPVAAALEVGRAVRQLDRIALVEQEDRLGLGSGRTQEPEPAFLRARGVDPLLTGRRANERWGTVR